MSRAQLTSTVEQNTGGAVAPFVAGKNKIINGDFNINQRSFTSTTSTGTFTFDRWKTDNSGGTVTWSAQAFTPGAAPVAGYESTNYVQVITSGQSGTNYAGLYTRLEDCRLFANQTVTLSFWAKAASGTPSILPTLAQQVGSGGSGSTQQNLTAKAIGTSWVRYSWTATLASLSGATIGTNSSLQLEINFSDGGGNGTTLGIQNNTFSIWGVQLEAGSVATPFTTATGTLSGELQACQRYYVRFDSSTSNYANFPGAAQAYATTGLAVQTTFPVTMRGKPGSIESSTLRATDGLADYALSSITLSSTSSSQNVGAWYCSSTGLTTYRPYATAINSSSSGYLAFSAEL